MSHFIDLKILTPEKIVYQDEVIEITLPTEAGEITILPDHAPLVTIAKTGEIRFKKANTEDIIALSLSSGVVEIRPSSVQTGKNSEVVILADNSELASEIDLSRAEAAYERAKKAMEEDSNMLDQDFAKFQALIDRELNRVRIAKKWQK